MLESALAAPLHFTIEFAGFVVAAGAAVLVASRPSLVPGRPIGRFTASAGFLMLALAGMLHGASFIVADTDGLLVGLRAVGWVVIGLAVAGAAPEGAATSAVVSGGRPVLYLPAGAALLTAVAALGRARSVSSALNRLAVAAALTAAGEALVAVAPSAVIEGESASGLSYAAHGLRFTGYVALASWLWTAARASVRSRFVAAFALLLVVVVLALSTTMTGVISRNVEREGMARVRTQLQTVAQDIDDQKSELLGVVNGIAGSKTIRMGLDRSQPLGSSARRLVNDDAFDLDIVGLFDAGGTVVALYGDTPSDSSGTAAPLEFLQRGAYARSVVVRRIKEGDESAVAVNGWTQSKEQGVAILASEEVLTYPRSDRQVGIGLVGRYLDASTVEEISETFDPASATLFLDDRVFANALHGPLDIPSGITTEPGLVDVVQQVVGERRYFSAFVRLESVGGELTLALSSPADIVADTRRDLTRGMFVTAAAVGVLALALAWLSGRRITRPIQSLTSTARAVSRGDLMARAAVTGNDEVGQLSTTFNDMTAALVRMTEAEKALRSRIETIIQSMADGLVAVDADRRILAFNIEAELLTGVSAEVAMGRVIDEVLEVRDGRDQPVRLPIQKLSEGAVGDVYIARRYGAPIPVAITTAVLRNDDNNVIGAVAVIRDMSRERELDKLKGEFLSNISHELRTPLTPIKGYAEILTKSGVPEQKMTQFARGILESTRKLERIVALLVDYSAIEAGQLEPRASVVDVGSIVQSVADEWTARAPRHEIETTLASDLPRVSGDERLLRRTLEEILDNAVKFSPDGGRVRLEARRGSNGNDGSAVVQLIVTDEGIGIMPEDLPTIFSDFHQLDGSETRTYGGLGLGLAFVQRIVYAHQGEIKVDSHPNRGTRLTITIPASGDAGVA
jgi:PAS domain S-box-containing protein